MDVLANYSIFQELQLVHDTGYFSAMPSLEENWQQVRDDAFFLSLSLFFFCYKLKGFETGVRHIMCALVAVLCACVCVLWCFASPERQQQQPCV